MSAAPIGEEDVNRFIINEIETVPHLEALLLLWNTRPQRWSTEKLSERLFVSPDAARGIMDDLSRRRLVNSSEEAEEYYYESGSEDRDDLIEAVDRTYRRELVRISNLIHAKAPSAVREFARAFKFTKEKD